MLDAEGREPRSREPSCRRRHSSPNSWWVWRRSKVVPLVGIQYRLARWPYGTKGLKRLRVGTAARGTWHVADYREYLTIVNIY
jgi:hypothetical protein